MRQIPNHGDQRQLAQCVYCGLGTDTRDHVPPRVFLDKPYPDNLPVVPACQSCNVSFSQDEEYVACLVDCVVAGAADPDKVRRPKVGRILRERAGLRKRLDAAHRPTVSSFEIETERVETVMLKLARGHAAYELNEPQLDEPGRIVWSPLATLPDTERKEFESPPIPDIFPEVGSRGMQRLLVAEGSIYCDWIVAQEGRYRYLAAVTSEGVLVRTVLSEYLGCEVFWLT
jgi:hypothetical protein